MTTKDHCLPFKGKHDLHVIGTSHIRYDNLNLNQKHQSLLVENVHSNDFSNQSKKAQNFDLTHDTPNNKSSLSWKKFENNLPSEYLNIHYGSDKNKSKEEKHFSNKSNKNASTLSLHIAAYENSIEAAASDLFEGINQSKDKSNFIKHLKNVKPLSPSINNPFEFPRQQTDYSTDPAIMHFAVSQRLLNPNQGNGSDSITPNRATGSSVSYGTLFSG